MRIAVLGASGATGRHLVAQALERGHDVFALVRDPARCTAPGGVRVLRSDVLDADTVIRAVSGAEVVVSGLGTRKGDQHGVLSAGARALADGPRTVWLGSLGTGVSARHAGCFVRGMLRVVLGEGVADKEVADALVRGAGGSVLHAGPLTNGPLSSRRRTVELAYAPRRSFPRAVSRATVAAALLDEAEEPRFTGRTAVPLAQ